MTARRLGDWYFRTGPYAPPPGAYPWRWKLHNSLTTVAIGTPLTLVLARAFA